MRPLPLGVTEFEEWSDRIIAGAMIGADPETQKASLCQMILHLSPHDHMKPDIHFISQLRKAAVNQVAAAIHKEIFDKVKKRTAEAEAKAKAEQDAIDAIDEAVQETLTRIGT